MKQDLYINQIDWFRQQTKQNLQDLETDKQKGFVTEFGYRHARSRLLGKLNALDMNLSCDIHEQIMYNIKVYDKAQSGLKVNVLNNDDPNLGIFHLVGGAMMQSLILLTIFDNPQSCCPKNKEILIGKTINDLEVKLQNAMYAKDKKVINELKAEIGIMTKQYQDNLKVLNK